MEEKQSMLRQRRRRRRRGLGMVRAGMRVRPWTKCMMEEPDGTKNLMALSGCDHVEKIETGSNKGC